MRCNVCRAVGKHCTTSASSSLGLELYAHNYDDGPQHNHFVSGALNNARPDRSECDDAQLCMRIHARVFVCGFNSPRFVDVVGLQSARIALQRK